MTAVKRRRMYVCTWVRPWGSSSADRAARGVCVAHPDAAAEGVDLSGATVYRCPHCNERFAVLGVGGSGSERSSSGLGSYEKRVGEAGESKQYVNRATLDPNKEVP